MVGFLLKSLSLFLLFLDQTSECFGFRGGTGDTGASRLLQTRHCVFQSGMLVSELCSANRSSILDGTQQMAE